MPSRAIRASIIVDATLAELGFKRASSSAKHFNRDLERTFRGAVSGTAVFHGLGRSIAFASSEFLGAAGFVAALRSTVNAAVENQRVLGQTEVAVTRSGQSWAKYGKQVQAATTQQSNFSGFAQEDLLKSFTAFDRTTGSVTKSLTLNALAMDVARGKGKGLDTGTAIVTKALLGQGKAVQRLTGIELPKAATAYQILTALQNKFAGATANFGDTTAGRLAKFNVALGNTQVALGNQLLPTLNTYLDKASSWLSSTKNQATLQHDLATAVSTTGTVVHGLASGAKTVTDALGGIKTTVEILIGLKVASVITGWARAFGGLTTSIKRAAAAGGSGGTLGTPSTGRFGGLRSAASNTPLIGPLIVAAGTAGGVLGNKAGEAFNRAVAGGGNRGDQAALARQALLARPSNAFPGVSTGVTDIVHGANRLVDAFDHASRAVQTGATVGDLRAFRSRQTTGTFTTPTSLQVAAARAATTKTVADDRAAAQAIRNYAQKAIESGRLKGKELINAFNALANANATLAGLLTKSTFTVPLALQINEARAGATRGIGDDKAAAAATKAFAEKQIRSGKVRGTALIDAFNAIASANSTIDQKVEKVVQQFEIPLDIQIAAAKAGTTATERDDERATKAIRAFTQRAINSGKLKGQALVDAFNELAQLNQQINDKLNQKIDQLRGQFGGLFQGPVLAPTESETRAKLGFTGPSAPKLTADLAAQNAAFAREQRDLARLRRRGAPTRLIDELEAQGAGGAAFVHTLATSTAKQLNAFLHQFAIRETQISKTAKVELRANTVTLHAARVNVVSTRQVANPVVQHNTVIIHDARDSQAVARNTAEHLQKRAKGNVTQRRGRHPGTNRGLK